MEDEYDYGKLFVRGDNNLRPMDAEAALQGLPFIIESGLNTAGMTQIGSGSGSNRDDSSGLVLSTVLTDAKIAFPLVLSTSGATVNDIWETTWDPPAGDPNAPSATAKHLVKRLEQMGYSVSLQQPAICPVA